MGTPLKLCILRLSAIGDVCHAAAMVHAIQRHRPDIEITWIVGKVEHSLLSGMAGVRFIVYDKNGGSQAKQALQAALGDTLFDVLFIMQVALRANILSRLIKAKERVGFDWHRSKEGHWLFANRRIAPRKYAHVLEGFMGFAESLGVPPLEKPQWQIPVPPDDITWMQTQIAPLGEYAVISPAASKAERNWLPERYAAIVDYLHQQGLAVVMCGGPGKVDKEISQAIEAHSAHLSVNLVGKTSLKQMLAVLSKARMVIAPDTGPAHMATTQGVPVIGLYAHSNPRRTGPYLSQNTTVSVYDEVIKSQTGKDWRKLPWGKRAKGSDLMEKITVQAVKSQIQRILHNM
ncbi:glycosyltransferase family 9 protein [Agaribacter flavus]|uniref:Glycosyltransferase family 9 protein n=1 Tax=Agaribacter flavus TaxID=1902781 RepID=A0ABV7FTU0_9ALTE